MAVQVVVIWLCKLWLILLLNLRSLVDLAVQVAITLAAQVVVIFGFWLRSLIGTPPDFGDWTGCWTGYRCVGRTNWFLCCMTRVLVVFLLSFNGFDDVFDMDVVCVVPSSDRDHSIFFQVDGEVRAGALHLKTYRA